MKILLGNMENIKPCPICKGTKTELIPRQYWTGMSYKPLSVELHHWCDKQEDEFLKGSITIRAKTEEQAIEFWNGK